MKRLNLIIYALENLNNKANYFGLKLPISAQVQNVCYNAVANTVTQYLNFVLNWDALISLYMRMASNKKVKQTSIYFKLI